MNGIRILAFALVVFLSAPALHAATVSVRGEEARAALDTLAWAPYVSSGHGSKVVYIIGRPGCTRSAALYAALRDLGEQFEFRWIILEDVEHARARLFVLEDRSAASLDALYGGQDRPAGDKHDLAWESMRVNNVVLWLFMDQIGYSGQYGIPAVVVETGDGLEFKDYESFYGDGMLSALSGAAESSASGSESKPERPDPLLEKIVSGVEKGGDFVALNDVNLKLYPSDDAPVVVTLKVNYSLPVASALEGGWLGLRAFGDYAAGFVYVRESQGKLEQPVAGK